MKYKLNNNSFDIRLEIKARVLPLAVPESEDKLLWEQIEASIDFHAKILGKALETYLEFLAQREYDYRFPETKK